jgi:hypothetical protein
VPVCASKAGVVHAEPPPCFAVPARTDCLPVLSRA